MTTPPELPPRGTAAYLGVGCFTMIAGFFGGGMIALLVGMVVGYAKGCQPPQGLPICDWHLYYFPGGLAGMLLLPTYAIWRLRSGDRAAARARNENRGTTGGTR